MHKKDAIKEIESAIFCQSGILPCDKMIKFINRQLRVRVLDLANLVRYGKNKRLEFESEMTRMGYKEDGQTYTYIIP